MKVLVTNDDGIFAEGLWALVSELKKIAEVIVVAPEREQSGIGTAITLKKPLRVQEVKPAVPEVKAYSVDATPADSVIIALEKLVKKRVDLVISGINPGPNLGHDVFVSGTVGAALQGYLRGYSSLAISVYRKPSQQYLARAAKVATLLSEKIYASILPSNILLNVYIPELPLAEIKGMKITRLADVGHVEPVEKGSDGKLHFHYLIPQELGYNNDEHTDVGAVKQGNISITTLHNYFDNKSAYIITDSFCAEILEELKKGRD